LRQLPRTQHCLTPLLLPLSPVCALHSLAHEQLKPVPRDAGAKAKRETLLHALAGRIRTLRRNLQSDNSARAMTQAQYDDALTSCLTAYGDCLATGSTHDTAALFRLIALWYKSAHLAPVNALLHKVVALPQQQRQPRNAAAVRALPSAKFLPLVWQLVARLEPEHADATGFQPALHALVGRLARDHPYHSLYQLMALRDAGSVGEAQLVNAPTSKITAARGVLDGVRGSSARLAEIVAQMEVMVDAYTRLALLDVPAASKVSGLLALPSDVRRLNAQPLVPITTAHLDVDPTCTYAPGSFASFKAFVGSNADLVGGVNLPRKITVTGSDGKHYVQMVKGKDDLRQDAVMQQVFGHANALLRGAPGARARALHVNTYRVVPFNPLAGLVEWCTDTVPLSEWLFKGNSPAHGRLRPDDMTYNSAFKRMQDAAAAGTPNGLRTTYDTVCTRYKPVMAHFFLESFPTASLWYERRLAYTRSVAVSSMVGYVIGLGDRHCSNILIGQHSAEVVHIDLGIAFDQGKLLTTPETVPFRLTRDIVDGFGAAGVEGVMRRCCEETLSVLRANKESLLTLVEVLIHDPILKWAMSPEVARRRQAGQPEDDADNNADAGAALPASMALASALPAASGAAAAAAAGASAIVPDAAAVAVQNADAERALLRVRQKLDGIDDSEPRSVEGQVQQLIQDARDPDKLCRLFVGWAPWV
jgi:ataxia telangiectasia mutated family protein